MRGIAMILFALSIGFAHSGWIAPNSQGLFSYFNSYQSSGAPVSAIYMNAADSIRFERNNFHHIGARPLALILPHMTMK